MEFYEIEYILQELEESNKAEMERQKKEEAEAKKQTAQFKQPSLGKTDYGGFKTPKMNLPKLPIR